MDIFKMFLSFEKQLEHLGRAAGKYMLGKSFSPTKKLIIKSMKRKAKSSLKTRFRRMFL